MVTDITAYLNDLLYPLLAEVSHEVDGKGTELLVDGIKLGHVLY